MSTEFNTEKEDITPNAAPVEGPIENVFPVPPGDSPPDTGVSVAVEAEPPVLTDLAGENRVSFGLSSLVECSDVEPPATTPVKAVEGDDTSAGDDRILPDGEAAGDKAPDADVPEPNTEAAGAGSGDNLPPETPHRYNAFPEFPDRPEFPFHQGRQQEDWTTLPEDEMTYTRETFATIVDRGLDAAEAAGKLDVVESQDKSPEFERHKHTSAEGTIGDQPVTFLADYSQTGKVLSRSVTFPWHEDAGSTEYTAFYNSEILTPSVHRSELSDAAGEAGGPWENVGPESFSPIDREEIDGLAEYTRDLQVASAEEGVETGEGAEADDTGRFLAYPGRPEFPFYQREATGEVVELSSAEQQAVYGGFAATVEAAVEQSPLDKVSVRMVTHPDSPVRFAHQAHNYPTTDGRVAEIAVGFDAHRDGVDWAVSLPWDREGTTVYYATSEDESPMVRRLEMSGNYPTGIGPESEEAKEVEEMEEMARAHGFNDIPVDYREMEGLARYLGFEPGSEDY